MSSSRAMQRLCGLMRKAVQDYEMIAPGDKVMVGVSGGKDSVALTIGLAELRKYIGFDFTVQAVTLDPQFGGRPMDYTVLQELFARYDIPYEIRRTEIGPVVFDYRKEKNPCALCAKLRRGALHTAAQELGCNKVALGHHLDDAVETFYMNLWREGRIGCFSPVITGNACVAEVKLLAGKAVVKGELRVQCAWRAEGDTALQSQAAALPFQQVIDLEGITEDCRCLCVAEPVGFTLSQAESAAAQLTANVMLHLRAWRSYQLQVAVDAFSTRFETELTPQPLVTEQLLCTLNDTATAIGSGPLPDAGAQLRACFVHYGPQQAVQKGEGWVLAAKAVVTALAENTLGELESYEKTLEVAVPLPITPPEGTVLVPECWLSTENGI